MDVDEVVHPGLAPQNLVDAGNSRIALGQGANVLDHFRRGHLVEQLAARLVDCLASGHDHQNAHRDRGHIIGRGPGIPAHPDRCGPDQHARGRGDIGLVIERIRCQGAARQLARHAVLVAVHEDLDQNGESSDHEDRCIGGIVQIAQTLDRLPDDHAPGDQHDDGDDPGDLLLEFSIAIGIAPVGRTPGHVHAHEEHGRDPDIGQVIDTVDQQGEGSPQPADHQLGETQQQVEDKGETCGALRTPVHIGRIRHDTSMDLVAVMRVAPAGTTCSTTEVNKRKNDLYN